MEVTKQTQIELEYKNLTKNKIKKGDEHNGRFTK